MVTQPDFTKIFFDVFGKRSAPLQYSLRYYTPHFFHDVTFLSSLLHDSEILNFGFIDSGETDLSIDIDRDCWELYHNDNLPGVKSRIIINGVTRISLNFDRSLLSSSVLDYVYVNEEVSYAETDTFLLQFHMSISGSSSDNKICFEVSKDTFGCTLIDDEIPTS